MYLTNSEKVFYKINIKKQFRNSQTNTISNNTKENTLDPYFLTTLYSKKKNRRTKINLKTISNLNSQRRINEIKRNFSLDSNSHNYGKSFLKPNYSVEKNCHFIYDLKRNHIDDILSGNLTMKDFHSTIKNTFDYKRNNSMTFSPQNNSIFRNNSSREKTMKNIESIKKKIQGNDENIFYKEVNKINRILGHKNNNHNLLLSNSSLFNDDNLYRSSYQIYRHNNYFENLNKFQKNLTTNNNTKNINYFKKKNRNILINNDLFNNNYLKSFKKEKIHKRFPSNEIERFSNGLLVSPYI